MDRIPSELILVINAYLSIKDISSLSLCSQLYTDVYSNNHLWKMLLLRDYICELQGDNGMKHYQYLHIRHIVRDIHKLYF